MNIPGADPAQALKSISDELKVQFDEAGMGAVDGFVDTLDDVKAMVEKGPAKILEEMQDLFDTFKGKLQAAIDNPGSLAPGGGGLAACATWYGSAVAGKLKDLNAEAQEMMAKLTGMVSGIKAPMVELGKTLESAMAQLDGTVKKLAKLPKEVGDLAGSVKGQDDVAKIETAGMKKCLDTKDIAAPLDSLAALKGPLESAIAAVKSGVEALIEFLGLVPDKVKGAFDVPTPLCFLQSMLMSQAPALMTQLLEMVENMKKLDMSAMQEGLEKVGNTICNLKPETVSEPVKKFASSATGHVDKLDKLVSGAKLASGGGLSGFKKPW